MTIFSGFDRLGVMQGRLSPIIDGKIQSFPWNSWEDEFHALGSTEIKLIEWTLDYERLFENPLFTTNGKSLIKKLCQNTSITIPSITGDCFMQAPFWKSSGATEYELMSVFRKVVENAGDLGISILVLPLVDYGGIENESQETKIINFLDEIDSLLEKNRMCIAIESDYSPEKLNKLINKMNLDRVGINYDVGNSAALGFRPEEEFSAYGSRVINVHIKDRVLNGSTVPLGEGDANFKLVFDLLSRENYKGNYILQAARATNNEHLHQLNKYISFLMQ